MKLRLGLVCLVALVHAAIYIVHQQPDWATEWTDQVGYKRLGAVLAETGRFTRYPDYPTFVPEVIRTPGTRSSSPPYIAFSASTTRWPW